jgi:hypothetical protein
MGKFLIRPVKFSFQRWLQQGQYLTVYIIERCPYKDQRNQRVAQFLSTIDLTI